MKVLVGFSSPSPPHFSFFLLRVMWRSQSKKKKIKFPKLTQETNIIPEDLPFLALISTQICKSVYTVFSFDFAPFCQTKGLLSLWKLISAALNSRFKWERLAFYKNLASSIQNSYKKSYIKG